jgi:hypothetical protein
MTMTGTEVGRNAVTDAAERFEIRVDDAVLDDLRSRLVRTRIPDQIQATGWEYGIPADYFTRDQLITNVILSRVAETT